MKSRKTFVLFSVATLMVIALIGRDKILPGLLKKNAGQEPERQAAGTPSPLDKEIATYEKRCERADSGIDLALLASAYLKKARLSGDDSWYESAKNTAMKSLAVLSVNNEKAEMVIARVAEARHEFSDAKARAEAVLKRNPRISEAYSILVTSELAIGDIWDASRHADRLIEMSETPASYSLRGLVLFNQGREEEGLRDFHRAFQSDNFDDPQPLAWAHAILGRFLTKKGKYREADFQFEESLKLSPGYHLATSLRGEMEMRRGNYSKARDLLMTAFVAAKQLRYLRLNARAKWLTGDKIGAQETLREAEKLARADLAKSAYGHRLELAQTLIEENRMAKDPKKIAEAAELILSENQFRKDSETQFLLATASALAGNWETAKTAISGALSAGIRDAEYFDLAGRIEKQLGRNSQADFFFKLAQFNNPEIARVRKTSLAQPEVD